MKHNVGRSSFKTVRAGHTCGVGVPVPGPIAGAGLSGLILGSGGSRLVATAAEDRLNVCCTTAAVISRHPNKEKSPDSEVGARLGYACHGGSPVTIRTVTDTHFLLNRAVSEIRLV
jgi:hypothetical protein